MTESSRRRFLKTAAGGALTGGALLLPGGFARASADDGAATDHRHGHHHGHHRHHHRHRPGPGGNPPPGGSPIYSVTVVNDSSQYADFTVYQADPDLGVAQAMSLAWLVAPVFPQSRFEFQWTTDYSFVWAQTGGLEPGVVFRAAQTWSADPDDAADQQVLFTYETPSRDFTFETGSVTNSPQVGNLYIREDSTIPGGEAAVGLGMSGAATLVVAAEPALDLVFTPHPQYWITAGTYEAGQVLDVGRITNAAQLDFGSGFALTATLQADNAWTVSAS